MRRSPHGLFRSLKDQVRGVRYSLRAEAEAPGSTLPRMLHDLAPVMAMGNPALKLADGLFTEVESLATGILRPVTGATPVFPRPVGDYLHRGVAFSDALYDAYKDMLAGHGARAVLVSEQALDAAGDRFRDRIGDTPPQAGERFAAEVVRACAALAHALAEAKPIRKVTFGEPPQARPHFMLAPNLYCGMTVGIAAALVTLHPDLAADPASLLESVDSVADVRFPRFKRAMVSKAPERDLAREIEVLLPFLP